MSTQASSAKTSHPAELIDYPQSTINMKEGTFTNQRKLQERSEERRVGKEC